MSDNTPDETYRRFHSGRFGPAPLDINYNTQIAGAIGGQPAEKKSKEEKEPDREDLDFATGMGGDDSGFNVSNVINMIKGGM